MAFVPEGQADVARHLVPVCVYRQPCYAPKGLEDSALGFQPWEPKNKRLAMKGREERAIRHITITPSFCMLTVFDLPLLQGASIGDRFPGLKPWAESSKPLRGVQRCREASSRTDGAIFLLIPGTSCLATIVLTLRDKPICPSKRLASS
jgi:hypothetical protein